MSVPLRGQATEYLQGGSRGCGIALLVAVLLGFGCYKGLDWAHVERIDYLRLPSPNGQCQLLVVRTDAGATTAFGYHLFVVPTGETENAAFKVGIATGGDVQAVWKNNDIVELHLIGNRHLWDTKTKVTVPVWPRTYRKVHVLFR